MIAINTLADIAGDAAPHAIAATGQARWIQFAAPTTNTGVVRVGDANISTARGVPVVAGGGMFFPPITVDQREDREAHLYDLSTIKYQVAVGDTVSITWGI